MNENNRAINLHNEIKSSNCNMYSMYLLLTCVVFIVVFTPMLIITQLLLRKMVKVHNVTIFGEYDKISSN